MLSEEGQFSDENCEEGQNTREPRLSGSQPPDMAENISYSEGILLENTVVKKWQDAISGLKVEPVRNSGLPLIFWQDAATVMVDILSTDITLAETSNSVIKCSYTKGGWILFERRAISGSLADAGFFLQNVTSGARIDLPDVRVRGGFGYAVFSTTFASSPPDIVAFVRRVCDRPQRVMTVIHVIRPGDEEWATYTTTPKTVDHFFDAVIIKGSKVYCFDSNEELAIFDLIEREWTSASISQDNCYRYYVMEFDDEIVKMQLLDSDFKSYGFYKLQIYWEERRAAWVEMSREEWKGRSFFVDDNGAFFIKTEGGERLYRFFSPKNLHSEPRGKLGSGVEAIDLLLEDNNNNNISSSYRQNLLPFFLVSHARPVWINFYE